MPFKVVDDPNVFLAALNKHKPSSTNNDKTQKQNHTPKDNVPIPKDTPMTDASPPHADKASFLAEQGAIRQVPVTEFSFPAAAALAPGEISTHTDGAPSPVALSDFSSTLGRDSSNTTTASHVNDLIGLGISSVDLPRDTTMLEVDNSSIVAQADPLSPNLSLIDSPIMDDIGDVTIPAKYGGVIQYRGLSYVPLEALYKLQAQIEEQIKAATAGLDAESKPSVSNSAIAPVRRSAASSTATSLTTTVVANGRRENPFAVRSTSSTNGVHDSTSQVASSGTVTEPKLVTKPRQQPFTSDQTIDSKWANPGSPGPAVPTTTTTTPNRRKASASASVPESNRAAVAVSGEISPYKKRRTTRPPSPIFGDHRAFGHLSKEAASRVPCEYPAGRKIKPKLKPGLGFAGLMQDLEALKLADKSII
jgi:hypothetical protein